MVKNKKLFSLFLFVIIMASFFIPNHSAQAAYRLANFKGRPPIHSSIKSTLLPTGLSPNKIKQIYNLPNSGGTGTIAIIDAYNSPNIENDLNVFSHEFNLTTCTTKNGCFEKHLMGQNKNNSGWTLETALDVEWAHAIAPQAKILLVEAETPSGLNFLQAIDYARSRSDVVAISISWGGPEFSDEVALDGHFQSPDNKITFFASSGDNGTGANWPAASPNVVAVGGTSLNLSKTGTLISEKAWSGSGGGISAYEKEPSYQSDYLITKAKGRRAIPDIAYNADPIFGFAVYKSSGQAKKNWYVIGGTSAGAPQWAAIKALGLSADNEKFYNDKASDKNGEYFRDIVSGSNGDCGYLCKARKHYDYITGLGSPLTVNF